MPPSVPFVRFCFESYCPLDPQAEPVSLSRATSRSSSSSIASVFEVQEASPDVSQLNYRIGQPALPRISSYLTRRSGAFSVTTNISLCTACSAHMHACYCLGYSQDRVIALFHFIYLFSHTYNVGLRKAGHIHVVLYLYSVVRELNRKPEACIG